MDMNSTEKHIKLNPARKKSQNSILYKKMYIFPENQITQVGGKNTKETLPTSFRNVQEYPTPIDLEKNNNPNDFKREKKPCHVCKKKSHKKEKKINLSRNTLDKPKIKRKKKKSIEYARVGKKFLLSKQDLLSNLPKDKNDKNLKPVTLQNNTKHVTSLDPSTLKFNSPKDFRIFFNKIYQNAMNRNGSSNERLNSYLQLVELYKSLQKYEDSNAKAELAEEIAEKLRKAGDLALVSNPNSRDPDFSIASDSNLQWWDPVVGTPKDPAHEQIMSNLHDGFVQAMIEKSPYIRHAFVNYNNNTLQNETLSSSTPLKLKTTPDLSKVKVKPETAIGKVKKEENNVRTTHSSKINAKKDSANEQKKTANNNAKTLGAIPKTTHSSKVTGKKTSSEKPKTGPQTGIGRKGLLARTPPGQLPSYEQGIVRRDLLARTPPGQALAAYQQYQQGIQRRDLLQRSPPEKGLALREQELLSTASSTDQDPSKKGKSRKKDWAPELIERRSPVLTRSSNKRKK